MRKKKKGIRNTILVIFFLKIINMVSRNVDENLEHETEFIIKSNESLAENKIKNETEQLLSKYKQRSNVHEHKKTNGENVLSL